MKRKRITYRAFTLIELVVTIAILAMMISFTSVIFSVSIETQRVAEANSEIMQKLRAITNQLNADFKSLRKDGEIFVAWHVVEDVNTSERFDSIMFFANGDFHSYHADANTGNIVRGNVARISYMLANNSTQPDGLPVNQEPRERVLARSQNILTADIRLSPYPFDLLYDRINDDNQWRYWRDELEFDRTTIQEWIMLNPRWKLDILAVLTGFPISGIIGVIVEGGLTIEPGNPDLYHMILCEGVGEFMVQGWSDRYRRWIPDSDPNGDGGYSDLYLPEDIGEQIGFLLYPMRNLLLLQGVFLGGVFTNNYYQDVINEQDFNEIPGLGRALMFTFTLYDSRGIFENGRTFTHIVYLDD